MGDKWDPKTKHIKIDENNDPGIIWLDDEYDFDLDFDIPVSCYDGFPEVEEEEPKCDCGAMHDSYKVHFDWCSQIQWRKKKEQE